MFTDGHTVVIDEVVADKLVSSAIQYALDLTGCLICGRTSREVPRGSDVACGAAVSVWNVPNAHLYETGRMRRTICAATSIHLETRPRQCRHRGGLHTWAKSLMRSLVGIRHATETCKRRLAAVVMVLWTRVKRPLARPL